MPSFTHEKYPAIRKSIECVHGTYCRSFKDHILCTPGWLQVERGKMQLCWEMVIFWHYFSFCLSSFWVLASIPKPSTPQRLQGSGCLWASRGPFWQAMRSGQTVVEAAGSGVVCRRLQHMRCSNQLKKATGEPQHAD